MTEDSDKAMFLVDFMLSDFVSDLRCATPSVAAEKITSNISFVNFFLLFTEQLFK